MEVPKVSVIIPTMNEEEAIGKVLDDVHAAMSKAAVPYEILIVDTNSKDRTVEIAKEKGARVIDEPRRGYGRAYKTGFKNAKGDYITTLDADCTYPADDIPKFLRMTEEQDLDFITGDRLTLLTKESMSTMHRMGIWILSTTARLLFSVKIVDSQSGMWFFRRSILPKLNLTHDGMPLSEEIKLEATMRGFRVREVPIIYSPRKGEAKIRSWADAWLNFRFLFRKRLSS
ncbi:MAG: glycosyltransferase family 2 protein [Methanobacteriota archaeon]|nr:MAG: glycosyltransferase family 2 protein [Euryarchaeota archaeon]